MSQYDPVKRAEYLRKWNSEHREYLLQYKRAYRIRNLEKVRGYARKWQQKNYAINKEEMRRKSREWRERNSEKCRISNRIANKKNRKKITAYAKARYKNDPNFKLRNYLACRINKALKRKSGKKITGTIQLLGCSIEDFWIYLESKFEPGMTRENYGRVWHIDHIMPCIIFDLTKPEHQRRCFHFSNLQPMFAFENHSKHAKITTNQFQLL